MEYQELLVQKRDRVAIITFNRPRERNPLTPTMGAELRAALESAASDPEVAVCILTGAGDRSFCSGAYIKDPKVHSAESAADYLAHRRDGGAVSLLDNFPKPVIAAVNGYCLGAGLNVAIRCDTILAAENAVFGFPASSFGIITEYGASVRLAQWVGRGKAFELAVFARRIDAHEAQGIGLANKVVPRERLMDEAMEWAYGITRLGPMAVRLAKEQLNEGLNRGMEPVLQSNFYRAMATSISRDREEGHRAWREKRAPVFTGQ
ncbi:MAG: enoyl-CoA hydratase/isomerase family protein [Chloroflexi bacterium]|nr:enoyl-CoA hydratase/isomerase family protein [Chloroflexota bacterium]